MATQRSSALDAAYQVLKDAREPLHHSEITRRILERGLWQSASKTPGASVQAQLAVDIKKNGRNSRFRRARPSVFGLNE